jgi:glycosyltransferase involved in cell wall biosynthesis
MSSPSVRDDIRIVINGRFLTQVTTGVQRYAEETLRALDRLLAEAPAGSERLRFELAVPDGARPLALESIARIHVPGRAGHRWEQLALRRHAGADFLVGFSYSGPLFKRRQLVTIHDATVRAVPQAFARRYRWVHNAMVAWLGRSAHSVMTVSQFSRDELQLRFGLRRGDIVVGREGGEHAVHAVDDAAVLRKHGLVSGAYVLGVGSVKPNKNYALLGRAMRLLPGFEWPVAIAGAKDIGIFADASALPDGFLFLGFVPDDELSALYRHAAWFVLPSLYEGFGLPAVEAMAHDCPVLAAHAAAMPEVCANAALYFDADDPASLAQALHAAARQPHLRTQLAAAGRQRLRLYNWRANAQILFDHLLHSVVPDAQRSASKAQVAPQNG